MKKIAIIGGGASGMICAVLLARRGYSVTIFERGARLGRKLSATGNGQGNVTNLDMDARYYFSDAPEKVAHALSRYGAGEFLAFLEGMGGIFLPDGRGRVYPAGRQASAVTDLFRREIARLGVAVNLNSQVEKLESSGSSFKLSYAGKSEFADAVVLAAGGKAAEHFGTDGSAYALAQAFGHTVAPLSPVLVQLRCSSDPVRGLKGIRVDSLLRVLRDGKERFRVRGDLLFTDNGVSGDAVFQASSYAENGDELLLDFLPDVSRERLESVVGAGEDGLLCIVNNGLGRALLRRAGSDRNKLVSLIKGYPLKVTGTLGFAHAQATRGGIPLQETDEHFMSRKQRNLYFAGEILNTDGACGGYNLQWAFTSAACVAEGVSCS